MQDTTIQDYAAFIQDDVQFTKAFSGIFGFREDAINANTANPPLTEAGVNIADNSQELYTVPGNYLGYFSLPTPIYLDRGALYHYDASVTNPAYFVSLIYKLTETQSIYATYDRVDAITGQTNFGGVDDGYEGLDRLKSDLSTASTLYEVGYKGSYLNNTLYGGISLYQQLKLEPQPRGAPPNRIKAEGIEIDAVYQPTKKLSINANFTYQNVTAFGSFFEETGNYLDAYNGCDEASVDGHPGDRGGGRAEASAPTRDTPTPRRTAASARPAFLPCSGTCSSTTSCPMASASASARTSSAARTQYANDQEPAPHPERVLSGDGCIFYAPRTTRWDLRVNSTNLMNQPHPRPDRHALCRT